MMATISATSTLGLCANARTRFTRIVSLTVLLTFCCIHHAFAQRSVSDALSSLLLDQSSPYPIADKDRQAAAATRDTLAQLLLVELSTQPTTASSGGFAYRFNPALGTLERASANFGPFYSERALRAGKGQASVGLALRYADFTSVQGASLDDGTFPVNASRLTGAAQPFQVDAMTVRLQTRTATAFGTYGVTNNLDVGVTVPVVSINFTGSRVNQQQGLSLLQSSISKQATGVGDVAVTARYNVYDEDGAGLAAGVDLRMPTGREEDLLGAGKTAARFLAIGSLEGSRVGTHANLSYLVGGASREFTYSAALTVAAAPRITLVGEFLGRRVSNLHTLDPVYEPHPTVPGVETMRWLPEGNAVNQTLLVTGAKWNLTRSYMLNTSLLIRLTDTGLTARVVPSVTLDYTFQR
jgi:Putative MetA-pathway of phenol degradation